MSDAQGHPDDGPRARPVAGRSKQVWDRISIIGTIATPILVAVLGWVFSQAMARRDAVFERSLEEARHEREVASQRIQQSQLLVSLMGPLTDPDPVKRQLAVNIALHALGEAGRAIVEAVSLTDPSDTLRQYAARQLAQRREGLIHQLVAPERPARWDAAEELGSSWAGDPVLVPELVRFARENSDKRLAVYNVTTVLADLPASTLAGHLDTVLPFLDFAVAADPSTEAKVDSIRTRLRRITPTE